MAVEKKLAEKALDMAGEDELLKLDNQLCFSLYVCSKEVIKRYKPLLEPYGLTYTGYITMMALWEKDNVNAFCEKHSSRIGDRILLYTKDYQKDGATICLPVYFTSLL